MSLDPQREALERALGAPYDIVRLLGRGGMGAVYLGREKALERLVAIKVLPPDLAGDAESRERFRREARTAAKLTHPNIVPLYTFGEAEGLLFFVMGYVRGESLATRLRRDGKLASQDVRRILGEIADALDYAHRQGVVHRDIKPDNILLDDESGRPMLTDFGVAKARASGPTLTEAGAVVGTPYYMSPEQASGSRDLDGRSDLYSLGVMGYQMLSGRLPFEGDSFREVIVQHVAQEAAPLGALAPETPHLAAAISRCLAKDPQARWPDGQALKRAVEGSVEDEEPTAEEERVESAVPYGIAGLWASALFGVASYLFPGLPAEGDPWWALPAAFAGMCVVLPVGMAFVARARRLPWSAIRRRMLMPPRWWPFWSPRAWRRPGDVWERLPPALRRLRNVHATCVAAFVAAIPLLMIRVRGAQLGQLPGALGWITTVLFLSPPLAVIGTSLAGLWWGRRAGLADTDLNRILFASNANLGLWRKPRFAALLSAPPAAAVAGQPQSPRDLLRAVGEAAAQLSGPARELGSEAVAAAHQLVQSVDALEAEIAALARDADAAELAAVEQKLTALGPVVEGEPLPRAQMRRLLEGQRDLLRRLSEQRDAASQRRAYLIDLLRTLWLQLASVRAEAAAEELAASETTGRIRAVLQEIERYQDATATVRVITNGRST